MRSSDPQRTRTGIDNWLICSRKMTDCRSRTELSCDCTQSRFYPVEALVFKGIITPLCRVINLKFANSFSSCGLISFRRMTSRKPRMYSPSIPGPSPALAIKVRD